MPKGSAKGSASDSWAPQNFTEDPDVQDWRPLGSEYMDQIKGGWEDLIHGGKQGPTTTYGPYGTPLPSNLFDPTDKQIGGVADILSGVAGYAAPLAAELGLESG